MRLLLIPEIATWVLAPEIILMSVWQARLVRRALREMRLIQERQRLADKRLAQAEELYKQAQEFWGAPDE